LPSVDHAVTRVAPRVREGGHHIPEAVIRRRWRNFGDLYRKVVDGWRVYDNSGEVPVLVEESEEWDAGDGDGETKSTQPAAEGEPP